MKDFFPVVFGMSVGGFVFCVLNIFATLEQPKKEQVGYTYSELQEMKRKCEEDLPRKQQCTILVQYLPQQEGK